MYRRKLGKSHTNNIHAFSSIKCNSIILTESALEYDACFHLEYNQDVITYESQPLGYEYWFNHQVHQYTPDFLVQFVSKEPAYIEVKRERIAQKSDFQSRLACQRKYADKDLLVWTEPIIRRQPLLDNLKILHRYRTHDPLTEHHQKMISLFNRRNFYLLGDFHNNDLPLIYDLLARGLLSTELSLPISRNSKVGVQNDPCTQVC